eukprot:4014792-Karenia_brevis.AAC.1
MWVKAGKWVCRHGVFFANGQPPVCPCLKQVPVLQDWSKARYMPHLCQEMRAIIAIKFDATSFRRLGQIQAEIRRLNW